MRLNLILLMFVSIVSVAGQAQSTSDFPWVEDQLNHFQKVIGSSESVSERKTASDSARQLLITELKKPGAFNYPFESVDGMAILTSPDEKFRIFNWNVPLEKEKHHYVAFLLVKAEKKSEESRLIELEIPSRETKNIENRTLKADEWYGALYYEIIPINRGRKTYYTLLGWDGNDDLTTRKYIDVISFNTNGDPRLGSSVFRMENGSQKRVIFEYANEVSMSLKYHPKNKRIVYDHLAPKDAAMTGNYAFYGPDLTYDALNMEKGKWELEKNVDVRMGRDNKPYNDPRPGRRR